MIISASRRTDIPAFYSPWLMNRIRAGYCLVPNPFNSSQVSTVSLLPEHVDALVFWTRYPRPLFPHLKELQDRGYRFLFLYTILGYPGLLDSQCPSLSTSLKTFKYLADSIGPERVIWRYDPIVLSSITPPEFHRKQFGDIATSLSGYTGRCLFSFVEFYGKTKRRLDDLRSQGVHLPTTSRESRDALIAHLVQQAALRGMELMHCAGGEDYSSLGVLPGKCVDGDYLARHLGAPTVASRDRSQRPRCGCTLSKDIGMYDSCLFGCSYCYATNRLDQARENHRRHDPAGLSLIPLGQTTRRAAGGHRQK